MQVKRNKKITILSVKKNWWASVKRASKKAYRYRLCFIRLPPTSNYMYLKLMYKKKKTSNIKEFITFCL